MKTWKAISLGVLAIVLLLGVLIGLSPKVSVGQAGQGTPIRSYAALSSLTCNSSLNKQLVHIPGLGLYLCDTSGNSGIFGPITQPNQIPAAYGACEILDFAICTSTTASGNPSYVAAGGSNGTITITGTNLVLFINGQYHSGTGTYTNAITGLSASTFYYVYVKADVANANLVAADFAATNLAPVYSYVTPTACTGASSTNPQYWFDMSSRLWKVSTAAACSFSTASPQVLFLGVAHTNATPVVDQVAHEPYNLSPYDRFKLFGDGFDDQGTAGTDIVSQTLTAGTTVIDKWHTYTTFEMTGATVHPTIANNNDSVSGIVVIHSQNPVLIINTSSLTATLFGHSSGNGQTGVGSAGTAGGIAGSAGAGGGGSSSAGGTGGGRATWFSYGNVAGNPAGGAVNTVGTSGNSTPTGQVPFCSGYNIALVGASGGGGGGDGTHAGGNGGISGGGIVIKAPSIVLDASSGITSNGSNGANGSAANSGGGGGGGGGSVFICGGFLSLSGTTTVSAGSAGTGAGTGGNGGAGTVGILQTVKLW